MFEPQLHRRHESQQATVLTYTATTESTTEDDLKRLAEQNGAKKFFLLQPTDILGGGDIVSEKLGTDSYERSTFKGDGLILEEAGSAGMILSADCPTVVMVTRKGLVYILHCGRAALTPIYYGKIGWNIISLAAEKIRDERDAIEGVSVHAGICAKHFRHDHEEARPLVQPFLKCSSKTLDTKNGWTLDLNQVIRESLAGWFNSDEIHLDGVCTHETDSLASFRRKPGCKERNPIIVVKKQRTVLEF